MYRKWLKKSRQNKSIASRLELYRIQAFLIATDTINTDTINTDTITVVFGRLSYQINHSN